MYLKKDVGKSKSSSDDADIKKTSSTHEPFDDDDDDDDDDDVYGHGPITMEELNSSWNQHLSSVGKDGGYDVECFPPTCQFTHFIPRPQIRLDGVRRRQFASFLPRPEIKYDDCEEENKEKRGNWLYNKVKAGAEMVINDINAKSTDGTYRLEDLDHVIFSTNFTTLMTLMTTKVVTGVDADRPVAKKTFQATVRLPPVKAIEIMSYRVKPVPGVEDDGIFRYKNPRFYHT